MRNYTSLSCNSLLQPLTKVMISTEHKAIGLHNKRLKYLTA